MRRREPPTGIFHRAVSTFDDGPVRFGTAAVVPAVIAAATLAGLLSFAVPQTAFAQAAPARQGLLGTRAPTVKQSRLTSDLFALREEYVLHVQTNGAADFEPVTSALDTPENRVLVDAVARDESVVASLRSTLIELGLRDVSTFGRIISGRLPLSALAGAESVQTLAFMRPAQSLSRGGAVDSQGDAALRADLARANHGLDGTGVTIGTLSDTYDCIGGGAANDVASGDLPGGVDVIVEGDCLTGTDEGRAMMQIIHDVAPGAAQAFHSASGGTAAFASGILALEAGGADVLVDDVYYLAEPFFQDGPIAQAVDDVVASGAAYFSAAGNAADQSYEAGFAGSGTAVLWAEAGNAHDFDTGSGIDIYQSVSIDPGDSIIVIMQWDTPALSAGGSGAANDLDLALLNDGATIVLASSTTANVGGDPLEILQFTNTTTDSDFNLVIERWLPGDTAPAPGLLKFVYIGPMTINEYATDSSTVVGHANAAGAFAVGAANYLSTPAFGTTPPSASGYTALGGTPILFDTVGNPISETRDNPDFVAPSNVDTTFFGFDNDGSGFPNFAGTSASAPHAAAVAALYRQKAALAGSPFANAVLENRLESTAVDMGTVAGEDLLTGFGLIDAQAALAHPVVQSPGSGVALGASQTFTFDFAPLAVDSWQLVAGSAPLATNHDVGVVLDETSSSVTLTGWPMNGNTVYLTLYYSLDGGANSEVLSFTRQTPGTTPAVPTLVAPAGAIGDQRSPAYTWDAVPGATWYRLYVNDERGNVHYDWHRASDAGCPAGGGSVCSITPSVVLAYGNARWWALSWNLAGGSSAWSASMSFNVNLPVPPAAPSGPISPDGTIATNAPSYVWAPENGSTWYQLWINRGSVNVYAAWHRATVTGCAGELVDCSFTLAPTLLSGAHRWWIRGWNVNGNGAWSAARSFTVP